MRSKGFFKQGRPSWLTRSMLALAIGVSFGAAALVGGGATAVHADESGKGGGACRSITGTAACPIRGIASQ